MPRFCLLLAVAFLASPAFAAEVSLAVTDPDVDWANCTAHGDGKNLGPASQDALAGLLGLASPVRRMVYRSDRSGASAVPRCVHEADLARDDLHDRFPGVVPETGRGASQ